jgi:flavin-dependent dehydrogenase
MLGRGGVAPELIERSEGPRDVVCGGFLGWDALAALRKLGVNMAALGAQPIEHLRLVAGRRSVEAKLPKPAAGLSRRTLDMALLARAAEAGSIVYRGRAARSADPGQRSIRLDDGEEISGEALLLATGKHELRGAARPRDTSEDPIGLRASFLPSSDVRAALDGFIELHLFDSGYAGLLLQEDGSANFCLSVSRRRLKRAGGIEPLLAELMREVRLLGERVGGEREQSWTAISGVPYGWKARSTVPGVYRVGDQGAVIASLAGDGIAIALTSGVEAAEAILRGDGAETYQRILARRAARPLAVAEALRWSAEHRLPRPILMGLAGLPALAPLAARLTRIG